MHPDLPPGVHQKALETYDIIFKCMGTNRLSAELFIYSAGLFPLLPSADGVRDPLRADGLALAPGLNGFLSGVLPSLEEGSEHYGRTNSLLEAVLEGVGGGVFYSSVWECVATNATIRLPALTFVLAHLGKKHLESQAHVLEEEGEGEEAGNEDDRDGEFRCKDCSYISTSKKKMENHSRKHKSGKIVCDECGTTTIVKRNMKRHPGDACLKIFVFNLQKIFASMNIVR